MSLQVENVKMAEPVEAESTPPEKPSFVAMFRFPYHYADSNGELKTSYVHVPHHSKPRAYQVAKRQLKSWWGDRLMKVDLSGDTITNGLCFIPGVSVNCEAADVSEPSLHRLKLAFDEYYTIRRAMIEEGHLEATKLEETYLTKLAHEVNRVCGL